MYDGTVITNRSHPGNPLWNCCQDAPAFVGEYADGSATVICANDAHHFDGVDGKSVHPLPKGWKPATHVDFAIALAESALEAYRSVAYSDDHNVASGRGDLYRNARFVALSCIINAYGEALREVGADAESVLCLTIDNGENVAYCVKYVLDHPEIHPFRI